MQRHAYRVRVNGINTDQKQKTARAVPSRSFCLFAPTEKAVNLLAAAFIPTAAAAHEYVEQKDIFAVATLFAAAVIAAAVAATEQ
jgi:hypothetical protein